MDLLQNKLNELNNIIEATESINIKTGLILMKNKLINKINILKKNDRNKYKKKEEEKKEEDEGIEKETKEVEIENIEGKK